MALQAAMAKALLVDRAALELAQGAGDVLEANRILRDAFDADVRPSLAQGRVAAGLPADPYASYLESGLEQRRASERVGGTGASWA